jgi:hypothetical protein
VEKAAEKGQKDRKIDLLGDFTRSAETLEELHDSNELAQTRFEMANVTLPMF